MKKILCLLALITALCTAFTSVYADSALNEALEYLSAAGIEFEYEEETIIPEQRVTRAVFAQNIAKLLNVSEIKCNNTYYHDVSSDHWAFDNVGILTELGILTGNGGKYFYPDEYVTRNEVATVIVSALGYNAYAKNSGGYPNGYLKVANELELFKKTSSDDNITLSDIIITLSNTLDANVANSNMSKNELVYSKSEETVLSFYHDKYYEKGTLTGCDGISFEALEGLKDGIVLIDGIEYTTKLTGLLDIIGTEVEFLYEADEIDSDERVLVWVRSLGRNDFVDVTKNEDCRFDEEQNILHYLPEGSDKLKKVEISKGAILIYNGAISTEDVADVLSLDKYSARLIKSKDSSDYDIVIVWRYDNIVVGKIDSYENVIYDMFDQGKSLDISDNREKIVIAGGKTIDDIVAGDILSYYESADGTLLKIDISKNVTEVTAQWIREEDGKKILLADEGEYTFYDSKSTESVINRETVKLYLDINGYIAVIDRVKADGFPAYLIKAIYDEGEDALILKTLDYDGKVVKRQLAEKTQLDGKRTELDDIYSAITENNRTLSQVVILKVDGNNQIKAIDTVKVGDKEKADSSLRCYEKSHTGQYKHHGRLVPKYLISPSTVIFSVPSVASGEDRDYSVKNKSDLKNDQWYTFDIYRYSAEAIGYEELVVIKDKEWALSGNSGKIYVLADDIVDVLNGDGEVVEKFTFNREGNALTANTVPEFSLRELGVKSGDLVQLSTNMQGDIEDAEIKYSYGSDERPINTMYNAEPGLRVVYAHEKVGNVLRIGHKSGADYDEIFEMPEDRIVVFDEDAEEQIRRGSMWDILDYVSVGNSCTTVAIQTIDEGPYFVVIYK